MTSETVLCGECGERAADCSCLQCDYHFCTCCFTRIHDNSVILRKHEKVSLEIIENYKINKGAFCKEHKDRRLQIYCNDCNLYCCKDCLFSGDLGHLGHSCIEVELKNIEILEKFSEAYDEANAVLKQLYHTRKKLQSNGLQLHDEEAANLERQVAIHYNRLHGLLQLQEEELLKKIRNCKDEGQKSLGSVFSNLEENIKEIETILTVSKASLEPSNFCSLPLSPLLEKLTNVAEMPCYLLLNNDQSISNFRFYEDPSIIELLKGHCTISVPDKRAYELCSKLNLPEDYQFESIPDFPDPFKKPDLSVLTSRTRQQEPATITNNQLSEPEKPKTEAKTKPTSYQEILRKNRLTLQNNNVEETMSTSSADSALEKICIAPALEQGTTEIVKICHLISPNNFYVQRKSTYSQLEKLRDHFSKQGNIKKNQPASIECGEIYLVQFMVDKKWYRAEVKEIMENKCEIFYIDYGNTETVETKKLREIPEKYKKIPDQAIHCSLADCVPVGGVWNEEAVTFFASMSNNVELSMFVVRINETSMLHEVHLRRVQDLDGSFTDLLIFLGFAVKTDVVNMEGLMKNPTLSSKKGFFKDTDIKKGDTFDGQVTHINTPTNFYLQRIADGGKLLLQLMTDLTLVYSRMGPQENVIFNPTTGMMVAAKFIDGSWYRAVIISIPRSCYIEVQYVDFGNVETVYWKNVRHLQQKFHRMSAQGLKCSLTDVAPKHERGWTASAKKAFEGLAKTGLLRVYVDDVTDSHLSVTLYEIQKDQDICINGGLVEKGYANSIGLSSAQSKFFRKPKRGSEPEKLSTSSYTRKLVNASTKHTGETESHEENGEMSALERMEELEKGEDRVRVNVLKVMSPSELYITFDNVQKQILKLSNEMTEYYESTAEESRDWEVGDLCAVLRETDKKWYRGLITEIDDETCKVYIKDLVEVVESTSLGIRTLDPRFNSVMDGSVKCHLSGIIPSGGSKNWTRSSIEHIKVLVTEQPSKSQFYITKTGDYDNGSLPIQMWIMEDKYLGPLDPTLEDWKDISKVLIDHGLALPERKYHAYNKSDKSESTLQDFDSKSDGTSSIQKWLENSFQQSKTTNTTGIPSPPENVPPEVASSSPYVSELEKIENRKQHNSYQRKPLSNIGSNLPKHIPTDTGNSITDWKPALPFKKLEFTATPSYVDDECAIYLQDVSAENTLQLIKRALETIFKGSEPKPHDKDWVVDQICIAFYEPDGNWYRGKVVKVINEEQIEVIFVDYGNTEVLHSDQLRKRILMGHIPLQCHRCLTEGIIPVSPDQKWPVKALDFIHATIVTQECQVKLQPPATEGGNYVILELTVPGGEDLMETLLSMHYATYVIDCDKINGEEEEIIEELPQQLVLHKSDKITSAFKPCSVKSQLTKTLNVASETIHPQLTDWFDMIRFSPIEVPKEAAFASLVLPDSLVEILIEPTIITGNTTMNVIIVDCDDVEIMRHISDMADIQELIQVEAEHLPLILNPVVGMTCVGCFTEDDVWYRAVVKEVLPEQNIVRVYYVDYGNEELLPIERLREIKEEWAKLPMMSFPVALWNVVVGPEFDQNSCTTMLKNCLTSPPYTMTIEARQPCLQVELFSTSGELVYQPLLDVGLLTKI
uniref:RING finger protein 17 n=1 Tax=Cuerna arida TaxID=1464854 RepID=A0A1B6FZG0_9HEMI